MMPFTVEQFFQVFESYNRTIWPMQLVAYASAAFVLWAIVTTRPWSWRATAHVLAGFWLWNGVVYHLAFFAPINPAAYGFAALFIAQGLIFLRSGWSDRGVSLAVGRGSRTVLAFMAIAYALAIYGILGFLAGHGWPRAPVFGVAPCPTTIFTLGILMLAGPASVSLWLAAIPLVWALIGSTAAVFLGVLEDLGLLASAAVLLLAQGACILHLSRS